MWTGIKEDVPEYVKFHDLMEELNMGKDSEARKRLQRNNSFNRRRQSFDGKQRSLFRGSQYGSGRLGMNSLDPKKETL